MAVDGGSQGKGLGRQLVLGLVDAVVAGGKSEVYTVIAQDNEPVPGPLPSLWLPTGRDLRAALRHDVRRHAVGPSGPGDDPGPPSS